MIAPPKPGTLVWAAGGSCLWKYSGPMPETSDSWSHKQFHSTMMCVVIAGSKHGMHGTRNAGSQVVSPLGLGWVFNENLEPVL